MINPVELFVGLRYLRAKRRTRFVSFITLISLIGIALGVEAVDGGDGCSQLRPVFQVLDLPVRAQPDSCVPVAECPVDRGLDRVLSEIEARDRELFQLFLADPGIVVLDEASSRLDPATEQLIERIERFFRLWARNQWKRERYAPSFHLDDKNLDPKTWCRFPILSGGFEAELMDLRRMGKTSDG